MKTQPTIYDIARECGLSIATVSRIMNETGSYSDKSKEKVDKAIEKLGYAPSKAARSLASNKTHTLALYFSNFNVSDLLESSAYTIELLNGVLTQAHRQGYSVLINSHATSKINSQFFTQNVVDGLILTDLQGNDEMLAEFIQRGNPVAYVGEQLPFDTLGCNIYGGYKNYKKEIFRYLHEQGHTNVLVMHAKARASQYFATWIESAVQEFYTDHPEISPEQYHLNVQHHYDQKHFFEIISAQLESENPPQTIVLDGNDWAMDLYYYLTSKGLRIPDDVSVVAVCHRRSFGENTDPQITVLYVNAREMGKRSVQFLINQIEDLGQTINRNVDYELIPRNSVRSFFE